MSAEEADKLLDKGRKVNRVGRVDKVAKLAKADKVDNEFMEGVVRRSAVFFVFIEYTGL